MNRVRKIKLRPNTQQAERLRRLREEAARCWNEIVKFHRRVYRKKGIWLSKAAVQKWAKGRFALHSQTVQALIDRYFAHCETTRKLRQQGIKTRYPYKQKRVQTPVWKGQSIRVRDGKIILPNGQGREPLIIALPEEFQGVKICQAELLWQDGTYYLSLCVEAPSEEPIDGDGVAAIDQGEIHAIAITDGEEALIISGREVRSMKRQRNKRLGQIDRLQRKCRRYSKRWRRLQKAKNKVKAKARRRLRDLHHKITRKAVDWCAERGIKTVVIGDLSGIAQGKRLSQTQQQKISQWEFDQQQQCLAYKLQARRGMLVTVCERGTSSTCPACGHRVKPRGRNFRCPHCGTELHRDVVGALNILSVYEHGQVIPVPERVNVSVTYLRIDWGSRSSSAFGTGHAAAAV
jgi:putative transposase